MSAEDREIDNLILYLRAYKQLLRDPNTSGLDSRDDLEAKIKPLFVTLMGYSVSLREKEEEEKGKVDERLKELLNTQIGERAMAEGHKAIKNEVDSLKLVIETLPKNNQGKEEIKANLRRINENVNKLERAVNYSSRKQENANLIDGKKMNTLPSYEVTIPTQHVPAFLIRLQEHGGTIIDYRTHEPDNQFLFHVSILQPFDFIHSSWHRI